MNNKVKIHYRGSVGWLVFWAIVLFPVALALLLTGGEFELRGQRHFISYEGSRGWLAFWTVAFFPVAILLLFLNGFTIESADPTAQQRG